MEIVLFDNTNRENLSPLTRTKSVADLLCGIFTFKKRWKRRTNENVYVHTCNYLQKLYKQIPHKKLLWIDASLVADDDLIDKIFSLEKGMAIADTKGLIAGREIILPEKFQPANALNHFKTITDISDARRLEYPWQIFQWNDEILRNDFSLIIKNKTSQLLNKTNHFYNAENIFVEDGAKVNCSVINALTGPVYIGKNTVIMEGCLIRGPFAMHEGSVLKMGTKIYGATTFGPFCTAGGEIKNTVMQGYSNKAHDGYIGDSVIGEWCNLGAGTSNSNVKNTGGNIKIRNTDAGFIDAGNKVGMVMGDYSKTAINTTINTGTIIGVCCNIFGEGNLPKHILDFSWGLQDNCNYKLEEAFKHIENWKKLKNLELSDTEREILKFLYFESK